MKLNKAAVRRYALLCSQCLRAGKFTRVGEAFLQSVETDVESAIRHLSGAPPERMPILEPGETFTNWAEIEPALKEKMELLVRSLIVRKVLRHPSLGVTLQEP
jgi:hypothetical protein